MWYRRAVQGQRHCCRQQIDGVQRHSSILPCFIRMVMGCNKTMQRPRCYISRQQSRGVPWHSATLVCFIRMVMGCNRTAQRQQHCCHCTIRQQSRGMQRHSAMSPCFIMVVMGCNKKVQRPRCCISRQQTRILGGGTSTIQSLSTFL